MLLNLILYLLLIIFSFYLLIKSADYLISSSSILGERAGISKFVIGLTLIAIGTSLPELFTSIFGVISSKNAPSFVFGTVVGSNIANILLVFSILLLFSKSFKINIKKIDLIYLLFSTFILILIIYLGSLNFKLGIILIALFVFYIYHCIKTGSKNDFEEEVEELEDENLIDKKTSILIFIFISSLIGLNIAAKGVVFGISNFGNLTKIPISFLTFTTVAFATSLPEMIVSYTSAKKKEFDLAIGNIIGSNISNILFILGVVGLIKKIDFNPNNYLISIIVLIIVTLIFLTIIYFKKIKYTKIIGSLFLIIYIIYISLLII